MSNLKRLYIWQTIKLFVLLGATIALYSHGTFEEYPKVVAAFLSFFVCLVLGKI
jgi:hypothetical protein